MAELFADLSKQMIKESLAAMHAQLFKARQEEIEEFQNYYIGGRNVDNYLVRHTGEDGDEWSERRKRAAYANYIAPLADALISGAYGDPVDRRLGLPASEDQESLLQTVFDYNVMIRVQRELAQSVITLGDGWLNIAWRELDQQIGIFPVHPSNVWYTSDPDNPRRIVKLIERREDRTKIDQPSSESYVYWIWTAAGYAYVNEEGMPLPLVDQNGKALPNPYDPGYGTIPYVHFRGRPVIGSTDGLSYIRDLVPIQRLIYNRMSDHDTTIAAQSFGVLCVSDFQEPNMQLGPKRYIQTGPNGSASYINPNAPIDVVQRTVDALKEDMFVTGSVPSSLVKGGTASSGLQLAIEMRPFTRTIATIRADATGSERELIKTICAVGRAHGMNFPDPLLIKGEIDFSDNILPADKDGEFKRDLLMVNNVPPLMTRADFLMKWNDRLNDLDAIKRYEEELDAGSVAIGPYGFLGAAVGSRAPNKPGEPPPPPPPGGKTPGKERDIQAPDRWPEGDPQEGKGVWGD